MPSTTSDVSATLDAISLLCSAKNVDAFSISLRLLSLVSTMDFESDEKVSSAMFMRESISLANISKAKRSRFSMSLKLAALASASVVAVNRWFTSS